MSNRHEVEGRTIHPRALKELGEEACIVALGVARDLRNGVIPPEDYNQRRYCGTSCCIAGHIALRMSVNQAGFISGFVCDNGWLPRGLGNLFSGEEPSDPQLAADAIYRFIYDGSETPWESI